MDMIESVAGIYILFHFVDIYNVYILYKHNCVRVGEKPKCLKGFRLEVIGTLLSRSMSRHMC